MPLGSRAQSHFAENGVPNLGNTDSGIKNTSKKGNVKFNRLLRLILSSSFIVHVRSRPVFRDFKGVSCRQYFAGKAKYPYQTSPVNI